jgi:L-ascorbate metabolism protein UlaG (beta-lactamase superfamily)
MELDKIIPLQETPKTPYQTSIAVPILRFRWIHAQCFQFELPGGKILMTDPFFPQNPKAWKEVCTPAFDADELGKVDYVTINHSHFDHTANLPDLFKQARPIVICDRIFARELSAAFQVPEACIRPIVPGLTYHFDDFTLNTFSGNHTDLGTVSNFDGGKMFADPENPMIGPLNSYGCLYNTNYAFTLKNGFFIGFAAGVDLTDLQAAWKNRRPGLLLRQRIATASAESYAEECASLGAQLVLPMHQDASCAENSDMNLFAQKVNGRLVQKNCTARMFNPQRLKWYSLESRICLDENCPG